MAARERAIRPREAIAPRRARGVVANDPIRETRTVPFGDRRSLAAEPQNQAPSARDTRGGRLVHGTARYGPGVDVPQEGVEHHEGPDRRAVVGDAGLMLFHQRL